MIFFKNISIFLSLFLHFSLNFSYFISSNFSIESSIYDLSTFKIKGKNKGWMGLGFGDSMFGSPVIKCSLESGIPKVLDYYASDEKTPDLSPNQSTKLKSFQRDSEINICEFTVQKNFAEGEKVEFIYALGKSDNFEYHIERDTFSLVLRSIKYSTRIDFSYNYTLYYELKPEGNIDITIVATTQGWLAFGLGSGMDDADIYMCNMTGDKWGVKELKSNDFVTPTIDKHQDIELLYGQRNKTHSVCGFRRKIISADLTDKNFLIEEPTNIIYAYGKTDEFLQHNYAYNGILFITNKSSSICDNLCKVCNIDNQCMECKYENYKLIDGDCVEDYGLETLGYYNENFTFYYKILNETEISFTLIGKNQGFIGILVYSAVLSDIIMCHKNTSDLFEVLHLNQFIGNPINNQSIDLIRAFRNNSHTFCNVKRTIKPNDTHYNPIKINETNQLIFFFGKNDTQFPPEQSFMSEVLIGTNMTNICDNICSQCINSKCIQCKYPNFYPNNSNCIENITSEIWFKVNEEFSLYYLVFDNKIYMNLIFKVQGWIAIGLGSSMSKADIFMCHKTEEDIWEIQEYKSQGERTPKLDQIQNIQLIKSSRNNSVTQCSFIRDLKTDDLTDTEIKLNEFNNLIYAFGDSDKFEYHKSRDSFEINITSQKEKKICPSYCSLCDSNNICVKCLDPNLIVINGECVNSDINTFPSNATIIPNKLYLSWNFSADNTTVEIIIKARNNFGYFALGIGDCMSDCDMHIVEFDNENNVILSDRYSDSYNSPNDDISLGGTNDLKLQGYKQINEYTFVHYIRKTITNDKFDKDLMPGYLLMAYAFGNEKTLEKHYLQGKFKINFIQGYSGDVDNVNTDSLNRIHGILLFVVWGGIIDIAWIISRYFKTWKYYIEFHGISLTLGTIMGVVMEILVIYKNRASINELKDIDQLIYAHFVIGIIIMGLVVFEILIGVYNKMIIEKNNKYIEGKYVKIGHMIIGIIIYILSKANIGIGIKIFASHLLIPLIIFYICLIAVRFIIELIYNLQSKTLFPTIRNQIRKKELLYSDLIQKLNENYSSSDLLAEFPDLKYIILNNNIYDISDFRHPGGSYILTQVIGKEIGRYFYGIYNLENLDSKPHKHSLYALNYLETKFIGTINQIPLIRQKDNILNCSINNLWRIQSKNQISSTTTLFKFHSEMFNINYLQGYQCLGKHFVICPEKNPKLTRLYTTVLCYTPSNVSFRNKLIDLYEGKKNTNTEIEYNSSENKESELSINDQGLEKFCENAQITETLPLIIKNYKTKNGFSNYIHNNFKENYIIQGPFGFGLEINKFSNGIHYIFAAGTGILPFLDLFDLILKRKLTNVLKFEPTGNDFYLSENFKIILFASFANDEEFIGSEIITKLYDICIENKGDWFDLKLRISKNSKKFDKYPKIKGNFDLTMIKKSVDINKAEKIYVCGPQKMNKSVGDILINQGVLKSKLCFV